MRASLVEAVRTTVRYETPDDKGETRRQRNARFGQASPESHVPVEVRHIWDWFWDELSGRRKSGPEPLSWADLDGWQRMTGRQVRPEEIDMLTAMDSAFVSEAHKEQADARERAAQEQKLLAGRR